MIVSRQLEFQTRGEDDVIDITSAVRTAVAECGLNDGIVTLFVAGSTAALTTVEYEPGVVADLKEAFARLAPREHAYQHRHQGKKRRVPRISRFVALVLSELTPHAREHRDPGPVDAA